MTGRRVVICLFVQVLVCALLVSCRPRGVLSSRELENILVDLHRCEGAMYAAGYDISSSDAEQKFFAVLFEKRGVTQAQFDSSLVWYTDHPQRFDKIYPRVINRLQTELTQLQEGRAEIIQAKTEASESRNLLPLDELMDRNMHGFSPLILRQKKEK